MKRQVMNLVCSVCQTKNDIDNNFCIKCANPLKNKKVYTLSILKYSMTAIGIFLAGIYFIFFTKNTILPIQILSWNDAIEYCDLYNLDGYSHWKLPSKKVLLTLQEYNQSDFATEKYWSATKVVASENLAWGIDIETSDIFYAKKSEKHHVYCERY